MTLPCSRYTRVGCITINTAGTASVVQFGDNKQAQLTSRAIAVQRSIPVYDQDEARFAAYSLFTRQLPPIQTIPLAEFQHNANAPITIGKIDITAAASASYIRLGCGGPLSAISRIKHIRQFNRDIR